MAVFTTIFDIVWLLTVIVLLIYIAVSGNRRSERAQQALIDSANRALSIAEQVSQLATRNARVEFGAPTPEAPKPDTPKSGDDGG